ncbi:AraC family transcriptional regulator [Cryobacterium cryoconiti]|uniref:AraC family transcriptional regulator n=1 Tax=Cryobacterium cryoconiti TaxID=1259239 RepID=A0A4Y8JXK3_9MICO|nr:AraC family transcriptional regulator [Cryobacterium cryoconiti]TFD31139.1 AraC family transcriptional regulator [Cryobacterium cryoconiti]
MFSPTRRESTRRHDEAVARVLLHIEENLEEPLILDDLATIAGFSPHHFHRVFHQVIGEAPKEYVRRLRLERAVYRMKVSLDNVLEIALDAGFATNETFTRAFIRQFGLGPAEFRAVLRGYRAVADELLGSRTFDEFTDETPLTLRFDMHKTPVTVEHTPGRHLLVVRHHGYEHLLAPGQPFLSLWDDLFAYAAARGIDYSLDTLVAITHDDPYVTEDSHIRFDACIEVAAPMHASYPVAYRWMPPRLSVARRHGGGLEEVAKTFAHIGVDWLTSSPYALATASPFVVYRCGRARDDDLHIEHANAYVPLAKTEGHP